MVDIPGDFSPDGSLFVFKRSHEEANGSLMVLDLTAGGEAEPLGADRFEDPGRFSPDGTSMLTSADGVIVTLGLDGEVLQRVAEDGAYLFGPVWSPDGNWARSRGRPQGRSPTSTSAARMGPSNGRSPTLPSTRSPSTGVRVTAAEQHAERAGTPEGATALLAHCWSS
jgi:Tol biopolymer transport system component